MCTIRVLLVEDSAVDKKLFESIFDKECNNCDIKLTLTTVTTMAEAWSEVANHDLMILDLMLPDSDDIESLEAVLDRFPIPVVIWTITDDPKIQFKAGQAGAFAYFVKGQPIPSTSIHVILGHACRVKIERQSEDDLRQQLLRKLRNGKNKRP